MHNLFAQSYSYTVCNMYINIYFHSFNNCLHIPKARSVHHGIHKRLPPNFPSTSSTPAPFALPPGQTQILKGLRLSASPAGFSVKV